jgi:hypothetical protein
VSPDKLDQVPNLPGSPVVSFCNSQFIAHAEQFRKLGCPLVWANCMTFMFDHERECFAKIGPADAYVFQSEFQRSELEPQLAELGYTPERGHLIRGAFDLDEFEFAPRPHAPGEVFEQFDTDRIVGSIIAAVNTVRLEGGIEKAANV